MVDWLAGGSKVIREAEVPHPCGYVRETVGDLAWAHPDMVTNTNAPQPNCGFDGDLIQLPQERETELAHSRR